MITYVLRNTTDGTIYVISNDVYDIVKAIHDLSMKLKVEFWNVNKVVGEYEIQAHDRRLLASDIVSRLRDCYKEIKEKTRIKRETTNFEKAEIYNSLIRLCDCYDIAAIYTDMYEMFSYIYNRGTLIVFPMKYSKFEYNGFITDILDLLDANWRNKLEQDRIQIVVKRRSEIEDDILPSNFYRIYNRI